MFSLTIERDGLASHFIAQLSNIAKEGKTLDGIAAALRAVCTSRNWLVYEGGHHVAVVYQDFVYGNSIRFAIITEQQ